MNDITVILNCYRRPQNLRMQIDAILNQTVEVKLENIWIWDNYHEKGFGNKKEVMEYANSLDIKIFQCNFNWKYCGRFAASCLVDTKFTAVFDDDTIPGKKWLENCIKTFDETPGILGGIGLLLNSEVVYNLHTRVGWAQPNEETIEVDLVGHAWFFPAEYTKFMWMEKPMWANGEDMHLSAMCQKYGNIKTYVPPHPKDDMSLWSSVHGNTLGIDAVASSRVQNHTSFFNERDQCLQKLIKTGWKLQRDK